jgi:hypothetical protein
VEKIKKLFALASNNPNSHEAELASAKAQELMMKHNISSIESKDNSVTEKLSVLLSKSSIESLCATNILREHYLVEVLTHRKKGLYFYGSEDNVEIAEYVYHFLVPTFRILWKEYQKRTSAPRIDRKPYIFGLMKGLDKVLTANKERFKEEYGIVPTNAQVKIWLKANVKSRTQSNAIRGGADAKDQGFEDGQKIKIAPAVQHKSTNKGLVIA